MTAPGTFRPIDRREKRSADWGNSGPLGAWLLKRADDPELTKIGPKSRSAASP